MTRAVTVAGALLGGVAIYACALWLDPGTRSSAAEPSPQHVAQRGELAADPLVSPGHADGATTASAPEVPADPPSGTSPTAAAPRPESPAPIDGLVFGSVLDEDGEVIEGRTSVALYDADGEEVRAQGDDQGRYSIAGLQPGRWRLLATARHHWRHVELIELEQGAPPLRNDVRLMRAPTVKVRLTGPAGAPLREELSDAGLGVFGLLPVATVEPPGPIFSEVSGSYNNGFGVGAFWNNGQNGPRLPPDYLGVLVLDRELPVYVSLLHYQGVLATQLVEAGSDEVAFEVDAETVRAGLAGLRVRLVHAGSGEPLSGRVDLNDRRSWSPGVPLDESGSALVEGKPPGRYTLSFKCSDRERLQREVELEPGRVLDLGTVALGEGRNLRARVLDPAGRPANFSFMLGARAQHPADTRFDSTQRYGSHDGQLGIEGLAPGDYVLRGSTRDEDPHASPIVEFSTRAGSVDDLVIRLEPAVTLSLQPADVRSEDDSWRYRLFDAAGYRAASGAISVWGRRLGLVPGRYELVLEGPDGESSTRSLDLRESLTVSVP